MLFIYKDLCWANQMLSLCVTVWNDKHYQDIFFKNVADISYLHLLLLEDVMPNVCVPVKT